MDPDVALAKLRELVKGGLYSDDDIAEFAETFDALDEWMVKGGFPPSAWRGVNSHVPAGERIAGA